MRRVAVVSVLLFLVLVSAQTALAQTRDPFVPLVTEDTGGTVTTGEEPVAGEAPAPVLPSSERLADTGFPVAQFVGLALALIGAGSFLMMAVRVGRPATG